MKGRFTIGYLGIIAMVGLGFELCLIEEVWIKVAAVIIDILALLLNVDYVEAAGDSNAFGDSYKETDGKLYILDGEDDGYVALGVKMSSSPDDLLSKAACHKVATLEIVNKMGGNRDGTN